VESVEQFSSEPPGDCAAPTPAEPTAPTPAEPGLTGDNRVDSVLEALEELAGASTGEQVAVYDRVQRGLQDCLTEADPAVAGAARPG
jgi:hypothetical protein